MRLKKRWLAPLVAALLTLGLVATVVAAVISWSRDGSDRPLTASIALVSVGLVGALGILAYHAFVSARDEAAASRRIQRRLDRAEQSLAELRTVVAHVHEEQLRRISGFSQHSNRMLKRLLRSDLPKNAQQARVAAELAASATTPQAIGAVVDRRVATLSSALERLEANETRRATMILSQAKRIIDAVDDPALERRLSAATRQMYRQVAGLLSIYNFAQLQAPLPPFGGWAISPDLAEHLVRLVLTQRPHSVVEAGSGLSTVVMGLALRSIGQGRVVALEHEPMYADLTCREVQRQGLADVVKVVLAPLVDVEIAGETWQWYDVSGADLEGPIDLLVVDGPPGQSARDARFPALPLLIDQLADDATIVLDDAKRADERGIAERWARDYPQFSLAVLDHEKGTAELRRDR